MVLFEYQYSKNNAALTNAAKKRDKKIRQTFKEHISNYNLIHELRWMGTQHMTIWHTQAKLGVAEKHKLLVHINITLLSLAWISMGSRLPYALVGQTKLKICFWSCLVIFAKYKVNYCIEQLQGGENIGELIVIHQCFTYQYFPYP